MNPALVAVTRSREMTEQLLRATTRPGVRRSFVLLPRPPDEDLKPIGG